MLTISPATKIFVVLGATDMRLSYNGLTAIVRHKIDRDPLSGHLFVFANRLRNRLKVLYFDGSGLWVSAKRLEKGTFSWPQADAKSIELDPHELSLLLGGIDLKSTRRRRWYRRDDDPGRGARIREKTSRLSSLPS